MLPAGESPIDRCWRHRLCSLVHKAINVLVLHIFQPKVTEDTIDAYQCLLLGIWAMVVVTTVISKVNLGELLCSNFSRFLCLS